LNELIVEKPMLTFTIEEVADKAGVSHRSVYRHFPTRKALFEALYDADVDLVDPFKVNSFPKSVDEIPHLPSKIFAIFDKHPSVTRAFNIASMTLRIEPTTRKESNKILRQLLANVTSNLDTQEAAGSLAVIRFLLSSLAWDVLQERFGLDSPESAKAVGWALDVLVKDLKKRNARAGNTAQGYEDKGDG